LEVSVGSLTRTAPAYIGHRVRVHLPAGSYVVGRREIAVPANEPATPHLCVFECDPVPSDAESSIVVTGTVHHIDYDGVYRATGVNYCTRVTECVVTAESEP
jgi:hypothetical protein